MTDPTSLDHTFPEGLHPKLKGLGWMVGHWEGHGQMQWPARGGTAGDAATEDIALLEQLDMNHNGQPYLHYLLQTFRRNDDGTAGEPVSMETGFWVPGEKNEVMVLLANPEGVAQTWHGTITGLRSDPGGELATKIELTTDAVLSQGTHTAGHRLYGYVGGKLMFAYDRADTDVALQPHLTGELERR